MGLWPSSWSFWSSKPTSPPIQPQSQSLPTETLQITKSEPESQSQSQSQSLPTDHRDPAFTPFQRARKQLTLYFGGAGFLLLSMAVARRSTRRRYLATVPNVGMMTVGAGMYIADVVNVDEMRRLLRSKYGTEGRMSEMDVEEEMEEWIASVLARKDRKEADRAAAATAAAAAGR
ncbi:hypothetical protein TWF569_011370 [Orbilia oligospora]|uniref:Altered inheritance of mitochondria protein 11 n=1 Tax=Orbilia oligospora TaxID=2813651 RepID=A0A7C8JC34_ORBOL|nr:hypothetical protein TWF103_011743 [Orbilia oligospora]KAF3093732.1 hypothetical protein TWF706_008644 [Orbilia oligospora]KAF3103956.1 hypothetical protein TWF102_003339 [Orbilia oligospora]KAF3154715.1 hypothetical protein TWF569_011370 [Orbilia oligospora]